MMYDLACLVFVLGTGFLLMFGLLKGLQQGGFLDTLFPGYFWPRYDD